jgi:hypothetical protein
MVDFRYVPGPVIEEKGEAIRLVNYINFIGQIDGSVIGYAVATRRGSLMGSVSNDVRAEAEYYGEQLAKVWGIRFVVVVFLAHFPRDYFPFVWFHDRERMRARGKMASVCLINVDWCCQAISNGGDLRIEDHSVSDVGKDWLLLLGTNPWLHVVPEIEASANRELYEAIRILAGGGDDPIDQATSQRIEEKRMREPLTGCMWQCPVEETMETTEGDGEAETRIDDMLDTVGANE